MVVGSTNTFAILESMHPFDEMEERGCDTEALEVK